METLEKRNACLIGKTFTYLTVLEVIGRTNNGTKVYKCLCKCGNTHFASTNSLKQSVIKSCGCLKKERQFKIHGMVGTRIYKIWQDMIARCNYQKNISYSRYGAKGVKVCDEWRNFLNFYNDMKEGYFDDLTLDRIDSYGNYEKQNCRWATYQEQSENKKNTIYLTIDGDKKTLMEWSRISGQNPRLIRFRLNALKWNDIKMAVFKPSTKKIYDRSN